ncbi:hypothetical protein ACMGDK_04320 [Chryseobacterium sp. DT-3]|uniref:hypothetical protein n=1 Tax=Chryseobacterium sp. DT-3 TaxID=3396164 RepID=UPI003F1BC22D
MDENDQRERVEQVFQFIPVFEINQIKSNVQKYQTFKNSETARYFIKNRFIAESLDDKIFVAHIHYYGHNVEQ